MGTYHVRVIGYNGAFSATVCYKLRAEISGTPKATAAGAVNISKVNSGVQLMPNPVHDKLRITFNADAAAQETISITDGNGRNVFTRRVNIREGQNNIDIVLPGNIGSGLYLLKAGNRSPVKFVKE